MLEPEKGRLLRAMEHGWTPTGKSGKKRRRKSLKQILG